MMETMVSTLPRHPAKYTDSLLPVFAQFIGGPYRKILDPMAGTGKIFRLADMVPGLDIRAVELEPEWAAYDPRIQVGNALDLPFPPGFFDAVITSPTYGNRMADHHNARDASRRNTYRHALGRKLNPYNSGQLQWGRKYREFHLDAWLEVWRVLRPGGRFIANAKDHIRGGRVMPVCRFHHLIATRIGFQLIDRVAVETPGNRQGQNGDRRVPHEMVFVYEKPL